MAESGRKDRLQGKAVISKDRDRILFSKCSNNQPSRGARISLKGRGSSTIRHIIPWTSRTKLTHLNHPTRRHRIQGKDEDRHLHRRKISIRVIMRIRCAPLGPWAQLKVAKSADPAPSSNCHRSCKAAAALLLLMFTGRV